MKNDFEMMIDDLNAKLATAQATIQDMKGLHDVRTFEFNACMSEAVKKIRGAEAENASLQSRLEQAEGLARECRDAIEFMKRAIKAGLEGFAPEVEDEIAENHVNVKALSAALSQFESGGGK